MGHFLGACFRPWKIVAFYLALGVAGSVACLPPSSLKAPTSGGDSAPSTPTNAPKPSDGTSPENPKTDGFTADGRDPADVEEAHRLFLEAGGTDASDAAVKAGLDWLIAHQSNPGNWSMDHFNRDTHCTCTGEGRKNDIAATAFGILPFLARGESHRGGETGRYTKNLENALKYLISRQKADGDLRDGDTLIQQMYTHGLATIALCEAFDQTADPMLREPCQKAVDFILRAQYRDGGWRYQPFNPKNPGVQGDMSVSSWQLMALKAAQMSGMSVPKEHLERANGFLAKVALPNDDGYSYQPGNAASPAMTAAGMLCRQYLRVGGESFSSPHMLQGSQRILKAPPGVEGKNYYYFYYATQVMFNIGGESWTAWNPKMRDHLIKMQDQGKPGHEHQKGSWEPGGDGHNKVGGRMMTTSLALLTLEVYYRQFPLNRLELGDAFKGPATPTTPIKKKK